MIEDEIEKILKSLKIDFIKKSDGFYFEKTIIPLRMRQIEMEFKKLQGYDIIIIDSYKDLKQQIAGRQSFI